MKQSRFGRAICAIVLVIMSATTVAARHGAGFLQIEEAPGARGIAMGSAGAADANVGSLYYNPAGPGLSHTSRLSIEYGQQSGDLSRTLVEPSFVFTNWFIGAGFITTGIDGFKTTDETGIAPASADFSTQTTQIALGGGLRQPRFSLGITANLLEERIRTQAAYAVTFSGGLAGWIIPEKLSAAIAGFHLGTTKGMVSSSNASGTPSNDTWGKGSPLPRSGRAGLAWHDTLKSFGYSAALDIVYRDENDTLYVPAGVEFWPLKFLAIRAGKRFNHPLEIMNFGFGIRVSPLSADAGFVASKYDDFKWMIGLTYTLLPTGDTAPAAKK